MTRMTRMIQRTSSLLLVVSLSLWSSVDALASTSSSRAAQATASAETHQAMREWLLSNDRLSPTAVELSQDDSKFVLCTTRSVMRGEILFRLGPKAVWSAAAAYQDRDLGPKMRDFAAQAGPGFGVVALTGVLAAERIRRYRSVEGQGNAPESIGFTVPSNWGAFARWLWWSAQQKGADETEVDASLMETVVQGVNLLMPLLDVTARRAWSSAAADEANKPGSGPAFLSEEWAKKAMFQDGSALSWSRGELENLAMNSFGVILAQQRTPPPFLVSGKVGSLIPEPFVDPNGQGPETWPGGSSEPLALVPLVQDLYASSSSCSGTNAVLGSPPEGQQVVVGGGGQDDALWCVATRDLEQGEQLVCCNPWENLQ